MFPSPQVLEHREYADQGPQKPRLLVKGVGVGNGPEKYSVTFKGVLNPNFRPFNFELNKK